jgi:hypothetical protein
MNTPQENDFAELRRLLALKRHEQPPPGYFNTFSRGVIVALKAERRAGAGSRGRDSAPQWVLRLLEQFQARPALAGALGAVSCALVIGGLALYEKDTRGSGSVPSLITEINSQLEPAGAPAGVEASSLAFQPATADGTLPLMASNHVQGSPGSSLFNQVPGLETVPVDYDKKPAGYYYR